MTTNDIDVTCTFIITTVSLLLFCNGVYSNLLNKFD